MTTGKDHAEVDNIIQQALDTGKNNLDEQQSKVLLKKYGVPVVEEKVANSRDEALEIAKQIGYPVVLKGFGSGLTHKSEMGAVYLDLRTQDALNTAYTELTSEAGDKLEGALIQSQVEGKREFLAGLFRDSQFGPVVMFGLGGVYTEALADVSFRVAPLARKDAEDMLWEIKGSKLLDDFRGEKRAEREELINTLLALSRIGMDYPAVKEIDINPLLVSPQGSIKAVDALVVLGAAQEDQVASFPTQPRALSELFNPESVAIIGASRQIGKWGQVLPTNILSGGFEGNIYLVNPKGGEIMGKEVYASISDLPESVDLGIVTIPAEGVPSLIPQFKEKGIKYMLLITSGFGETGSEGRQREQELVEMAREAGILILGPNTMGICNPHINLYSTGSIVQPRAGGTTMISQSGNMGVQLLSFAEKQGLGIRGFCGSGNEAMLTIEDYLDGLNTDEETQTVMLYLESIKNGRRFFESSSRLSQKKPVILLKGGETKVGYKAASSHTGALSSNTRVFNSLCKQAGLVKVEGPMDLLDLSAAFSSLPLIRGNRIAIMTWGGGWGVITADICAKYGLELPELSEDLVAEIDQYLPYYWSRDNPIDLVGEQDLSLPFKVLESLIKWDKCDAIINLGIMGRRIVVKEFMQSLGKVDQSFNREFRQDAIDHIAKFESDYINRIAQLMDEYQKPVLGVSLHTDEQDKTVYEVDGCTHKPIFYQTPEKAVKACAEMYNYYRFLNK